MIVKYIINSINKFYETLYNRFKYYNRFVLYTLYYNRFKLIPIRVIWTKLIIVKSLILIIITTINMTIIIYILFYCLWVCVWMCTSVRVTFIVWFYDWLISIIIRYLWHHEINFLYFNCICHLIRFIFCFKITTSLSFIIEFVYVYFMSKPGK